MSNGKQAINTNNAPQAIGPYSQAVQIGQLIFASGQLGIDPVLNQFPETVAEQAKQSLLNAQAILEAAGASLQDVVKATVFLKDMNDFAAVNEVYASFFVEPFPARSTIEVARLPKDALVEIEVIASKA